MAKLDVNYGFRVRLMSNDYYFGWDLLAKLKMSFLALKLIVMKLNFRFGTLNS